jgi:hypothetical protein
VNRGSELGNRIALAAERNSLPCQKQVSFMADKAAIHGIDQGIFCYKEEIQ